ncbi:uncharacterized protein LOC127127723 [Lathyrus oleraceus]|uniref:uncharacterized protein LOC127127723 n=1 Tax=Pisum sativum TaxID=3888 RepID=UPI0021CF76B2|nr:uncharacterized protein LOC127127723 [Pisum sativum]XP_050912940.1 uncharacterized protein LOC127127723 [Pisum sativum]XP_050912941.1 uncharacterized protein LOC127127723 [Pisum sativum]XP_050912942.1 uncharacterized protein LOC127127723 [Pisum sativum]
MAPRKTIRINFVVIYPQLKDLVSELLDQAQFVKKHGSLLDLVTTGFKEDMMRVLFQFFDPEHHCFTFPDYQLVPTLEEFSQLLGIPILDQMPFSGLEKIPRSEKVAAALHMTKSDIEANWVTRSGVKGLLAKFLMNKAREFLKVMNVHAFEEILALLIYGLVLFPNPDQFIDMNAIQIFLARNPVPTLLGDILHSLHTRTMKRQGTLMCCIPLLSRWFISHLPQSVLKNEQSLRWSQRIMSLSHSDIRWCPHFKENNIIIDRCGEFPNVPLMGIRGGITYNPALALRQFGCARRDGPHEIIIQGTVFDYDNDSQGLRQRFVRAWGMVKRSTLGQKNSIPMEPYLRWVRTRARELVMPYLAVRPLIVEPEAEGGTPQIVPYPDMPTDVEELKKFWIQLREERDTFEAQFCATRKKVLELTGQLNEERRLNTYLRPKRSRPWET